MSSVMPRFRPPNPPPNHGSLCAHDLHGSISLVSSSASDRQVHPAVVRRRARSMDDVPALFPDGAAWRVRVRAFYLDATDAPPTGNRALHSARAVGCAAADHAFRELEGARGRRSELAHSPAADGDDRVAVFRSLLDGAAHAAMVQSNQPGSFAVSPVRFVECRIAARVAELS